MELVRCQGRRLRDLAFGSHVVAMCGRVAAGYCLDIDKKGVQRRLLAAHFLFNGADAVCVSCQVLASPSHARSEVIVKGEGSFIARRTRTSNRPMFL